MTDISKIDMERINGLLDKLEEVTDKLNSMKYVVETGGDSTQWYRKWNDGFIEQWGNIIFSQSAGSYTNQTTTLPIAFSSTAYYITLIATNSNNQQSHTCGILVKNKNSFNWYACGY